MINNDPELKAKFDQLLAKFGEDPKKVRVSISQIVASLIELNEALQGAAIACAQRLKLITESLNAYTTMQTQIPVILKDTAGYKEKDEKGKDKSKEELDKIKRSKGRCEPKIRQYAGSCSCQ